MRIAVYLMYFIVSIVHTMYSDLNSSNASMKGEAEMAFLFQSIILTGIYFGVLEVITKAFDFLRLLTSCLKVFVATIFVGIVFSIIGLGSLDIILTYGFLSSILGIGLGYYYYYEDRVI